MSAADRTLAVVTGAGRGIGRGTALALADRGWELLCISRTEGEVAAVAAEIEAAGGRARPDVVDVTDREALARLDLDGIGLLVNCAGGNIPEPFVEVGDVNYDHLMAVNVKATFMVSQLAALAMKRQGTGGVIVNVSSQMGRVGAAGRSVYCTAKHAVEGLTKAMAIELAPDRIRVNAVAPTFIETPMTAPFLADPDFRTQVLERIPLGRLGEVSDVTGAICFLASDQARMITGTSLLVDGGWTAQ